MLALVESFWSYGWILAATIGLVLIPGLAGGWRWACIGGALPALFVLYLRRHLPESPRYLAQTGHAAEARTMLREVGLAEDEIALATAPPPPEAPAASLWRGGFARRTALLWPLWFGSIFSFYGIVGWLPTLLAEQRGMTGSFGYILLSNLAALPGALAASWMLRHWGRKPTMAVSLVGAAAGALLYWLPVAGLVPLDSNATGVWLVACGAAICFFSRGLGGATYTYTAEMYPTRMRARGVGMAASVGRFGGAFGPYATGLWMGAGILGGAAGLFALYAGILCALALFVLLFGEETRGKALEEIAT
jgi:putative MFS transporter